MELELGTERFQFNSVAKNSDVRLNTLIVQRKTNFMHNLFLVYFVNLYMFRACLGPSSGGTTVCIQQLVLIILFR